MRNIKPLFYRFNIVFLLSEFFFENTLKTTKNITNLEVGATATINEFSNGFVACKLMSMGLLSGTQITLVRKSPFGGGYYIKTEDHYIGLRTNEAENVLVLLNI